VIGEQQHFHVSIEFELTNNRGAPGLMTGIDRVAGGARCFREERAAQVTLALARRLRSYSTQGHGQAQAGQEPAIVELRGVAVGV
jgi:hypothetical protein